MIMSIVPSIWGLLHLGLFFPRAWDG
jgi:hypothetical protein